jgi:uncharacterized 2Fe-2S/4Fe-4S cluster protein (DUF4445 family)
MNSHLVVFTPSGKRGTFAAGTSLLDAARTLGVDIDSVCGGRGICGRCQITLSEGEFPKFGIESKAEHLIPLTESEKRYNEKRGLKGGRRLSCHCKLEGPVVIDVPPESQVHRQVVRKAATVRTLELDPIVHLYYVEVAEMDMYRPNSDLRRLKIALREQWQLTNLQADAHLLTVLQKTLREGNWKVTVAIHNNKDIVAIYPGLETQCYGLAVDVGSTTIAAHLTELSSGQILVSDGVMNPQIQYGEDLMSRVSYTMMNKYGSERLTSTIRGALNVLANDIANEAGIYVTDILELTVVGNPVMHHLLLGASPVELGGAPFALATGEAITLNARDLGLNLHPAAKVYILPCIAGHVGADTAAMILSESPQNNDEMTLLVDIGTNAEIVLGNKTRLAACSSPTGPALEGAQISSGQRAAAGAIERVRIDKETLEPRFKIIGCELWSDEPGFAETSKHLTISGICGSGIIEVLAEMYLARIITPDGQIDGNILHPRIQQDGRVFSYLLYDGNRNNQPSSHLEENKGLQPLVPSDDSETRNPDVVIRITQNDVRAIQLAKAALFAGVQLLMDHLEVTQVEKIALAGAFGSHIDTKYAMILGLIPDCDLANVSSIGNAAGDGALRALLSKKARTEIEEVVENVEKIETAVEPKFQEYFVDALAIPNKTVKFERLEGVLGFPLPKASESATLLAENRRGERRRRRAVVG